MISADKLFRLDGKVALVTGGSGGIGTAVCEGLAVMGARVAIADQNVAKASALAADLKRKGFDTLALGFDALSVDDTRRAVSDVAAHYGRLDILVNTVGGQREEKANDVTEANFDLVIGLNLKSAMFQAQAAAKQMAEGGGGKQVHFGSVRSLLSLPGRGFASYCAAKGGLAILCRQLATEWAPSKVNVNVLAPTFVRTEQAATWLADPDFYRNLIARIPMGRIAETDDVVGAVLFLVSPASDFITGHTLFLDGGVTTSQ
jgi:gluconate 5-dehydrogenase